MLFNPPHPSKAYSPMLVTLSGIVILLRQLQLWNAFCGMLLQPVTVTSLSVLGTEPPNIYLNNDDSPVAVLDAPTNGIEMLVKLLHSSNADSSILVTLFGIVMLVKPLHP